jgi:integrase
MYFNVQTARKPGLRTTSQSRLLTYFLSQNAGRVNPAVCPYFPCLKIGVHISAARQLTLNPLYENDVLRMIKKRAVAAGLPAAIGCHTFRATGITAYLENGGTLEKAQRIAAHHQALRPDRGHHYARRD